MYNYFDSRKSFAAAGELSPMLFDSIRPPAASLCVTLQNYLNYEPLANKVTDNYFKLLNTKQNYYVGRSRT